VGFLHVMYLVRMLMYSVLAATSTTYTSPPRLTSVQKAQSLFKHSTAMLGALISSLLAILAACSGVCYGKASPGPWVTPTKGEPWPKPQHLINYGGYVVVRPTVFSFKVRKNYIMRIFIICNFKQRSTKYATYVAYMWEMRNVYKILTGKSREVMHLYGTMNRRKL
jgi:hypothetical protein